MSRNTMFRFINFIVLIVIQFLFSCSDSKCDKDITCRFENALLAEFKQTGTDDLGYKYLKSHYSKDPISNRIIISSNNKVFYAYPSNDGWYAQEENNIQKYSLHELGHYLGDELINERENKNPNDNHKQKEEKVTVNGEQTADFLRKVVKGRTDGGKIWNDSTVYVEQPSINYKGNKAWTVRKGDTYFIYSIDKTYNCYEKKYPADKWGAENLNDINSDNGWVLIPTKVVP